MTAPCVSSDGAWGWVSYVREYPDGCLEDAQVIPIDDLREHDEHRNRWCKPREDKETLNVWVHNSMDGREEYENGRRLQ